PIDRRRSLRRLPVCFAGGSFLREEGARRARPAADRTAAARLARSRPARPPAAPWANARLAWVRFTLAAVLAPGFSLARTLAGAAGARSTANRRCAGDRHPGWRRAPRRRGIRRRHARAAHARAGALWRARRARHRASGARERRLGLRGN